MGSELLHVARTAEWLIVPRLLAVELLTLKSGIAASRSPVNNCGRKRVKYKKPAHVFKQRISSESFVDNEIRREFNIVT